MRRTRALAAAAAVGLLTAGPLAAPALAAGASGVGATNVGATVLGVQLGADGDLLSIRVLTDDGRATIDGQRSAAQALRPLTITSKAVPALSLEVPPTGSASTGAEDKKAVQPALPSTPVFGGSLNAVVNSVVDAAGARSGLRADLAGLSLAGGLVSMPSGAVEVLSSSAPDAATGTRSISIPELRVLDLAAVLEGLGLDLGDLSVDQLLALVQRLGVQLPGIADPAAVVASLNAAIDQLQAATGPLTASLCSTVDSLLRGTLGGVTGLVGGAVDDVVDDVTDQLPGDADDALDDVLDDVLGGLGLSAAALPADFSCSNLTGTVADLLDEVQATLAGVVASSLVELGDVALLSVEDVQVGLVAKAVDTVTGSVADVTASIGEVRVGELAVPGVGGLDLTAGAAALDQAGAAVEAAVGQVLGAVNASLAGIVDVDLLDIQEGVGAAGGGTSAAASVTALTARLTPPADLASLVAGLPAVGAGDVLATAGAALPALAPVMAQLEGALGGLDALTGPAVVTVGQLSGQSTFRAASAPGAVLGPDGAPGGTLPRTGGAAALPAMAAVALGGAGLALRRILRSAR